MYAFILRLAMIPVSMAVVHMFPVTADEPLPLWYFAIVVVCALATSCLSTVMFVALVSRPYKWLHKFRQRQRR